MKYRLLSWTVDTEGEMHREERFFVSFEEAEKAFNAAVRCALLPGEGVTLRIQHNQPDRLGDVLMDYDPEFYGDGEVHFPSAEDGDTYTEEDIEALCEEFENRPSPWEI